jgi:hypothetical protein
MENWARVRLLASFKVEAVQPPGSLGASHQPKGADSKRRLKRSAEAERVSGRLLVGAKVRTNSGATSQRAFETEASTEADHTVF